MENQLVKDILDNNRDIHNGALGECSEFTRDFVKNICAKTLKNEIPILSEDTK